MVHPQTNGQKEAIDGVILTIMKKRLDEVKGAWPEELPRILRTMRTTPNSKIKDTSIFSLTFDHEAAILTEINTKIFKVSHYLEKINEQSLREYLDLIEEHRAESSIKVTARKQ